MPPVHRPLRGRRWIDDAADREAAIGREPDHLHQVLNRADPAPRWRGGRRDDAVADIRGSTSLAETMSPGQFHDLLERFYSVASRMVFQHDGVIDKFVGDELVAMFYPAMSGERHSARAIDAALAVLRATGHADAAGPWVPVGAGVHTGAVWFGAVGDDVHVELTALGDPVNTTARLAAAASAGEVLVSSAAAEAAGLDPALQRRQLRLRGKAVPFEVVALGV